MTRGEAWTRWRREEAAKARWGRELRRISLDIESLRLDVEAAVDLGTARMLADVPRYRKTIDAFLDLHGYVKSMAGWRYACGSDIGLFRKTRRLGWERLWKTILESRKMRR